MTEENKTIEIKNDKVKNRSKCGFFYACFCILFLSISIFCCSCTKVKHNVFVKGPDMHYFHNGPAVLLDDGNVLIIGGDTRKAEIYDYKKNKFFVLDNEMKYKRKSGASAILLNDGRVLITGGYAKDYYSNGIFLSKILSFEFPQFDEIYMPQTREFSSIKRMCIPRINHTAMKMSNGNILFFGGESNKLHEKNLINEIEEFDPKTNSFKIINKLPNTNYYFSRFVQIPNDKVIIVTSSKPEYQLKNVSKNDFDLFLYDYKQNRIESFKDKIKNYKNLDIGNLKTNIYISNKTLNKGKGGEGTRNCILIVKSLNDNILDVDIVLNAKIDYTLSMLDDETLIIIGGQYENGWGGIITSESELTKFNDFLRPMGIINLNKKRYQHLTVTLNNGNILILGGYNKGSHYNAEVLTSEIYYK